MAKLKFQTPTGMHDILPEEQLFYTEVFDKAKEVFEFYDFGRIETPILEDANLFSRSVGQYTDIVEKEMYSFKTKGGKDILALRPEGTAPIMRAYLENGLNTYPQPVKLWYFGPFFRHEKPQAGRFRQFWQFGAEVLGEKDPVIDAECISVALAILGDLKIKEATVRINSIGDDNCRPEYKKVLTKFLKSKKGSFCAVCQRRMKSNVLRVLDCKNEKCQEALLEAPQIIDFLCQECHEHFKSVLEYLDELKVPYILDPFLVRGLDYYTKTVFEIEATKNIEGEKEVLAAGGRYDNLAKSLGGNDTPACGMAGGVERIIAIMKKDIDRKRKKESPDLFLAQIGPLAKRKSLVMLEEFRKNHIKAAESLSKDSLKFQLGKANKLGIKNVLILGQKEAMQDKVIIRNMETGKQAEVSSKEVVKEFKKRLKE